MIIKICGITTREDAIAAAEAGATALGFNFYPESPRYVTPQRAAELGAGLEVLKVGVFVDESAARIREIAHVANLDIAQLHGSETPDQVPPMRVWKAFRSNIDWTAELFDSYNVEAYLLDGAEPGSGQVFPWSRVPGNCEKNMDDRSLTVTNQLRTRVSAADYRATGASKQFTERFFSQSQAKGRKIILAGGLDDSNVGEAIRTLPLWGVDACSRLERSPGIKDHEKVLRFVQAARGSLT
jgi:phosphoribosylanthranilate isomerase